MACNSLYFANSPFSNNNFCERTIRRSNSDHYLCNAINRARATEAQLKLKTSRSFAIFNFQLPSPIIPSSLRSFLFDLETSKGVNIEENYVDEDEMEMDEEQQRANWVERLVQIGSHWRDKRQKDGVDAKKAENIDVGDQNEEHEEGCEVNYSDDEEEKEVKIDGGLFKKSLKLVSWFDTKLYSKLAFLCNMAYVIPDIKAKELRRYYGLIFVTSSLEKKGKAATMEDKLDQDSTIESNSQELPNFEQKFSTVAYEIAASAASYVQSRAKDLLSLASEPQVANGEKILHDKKDSSQHEKESSSPRVYKSEVAAYVAASTMTAVVAAGEKQKQEAAKDLQSLHSSPCEWFICDDSSIYTRIFIIQGSDSLASWHANLFFEPTKFEGTDVMVHRGIYEAAKGIYMQFLPEIMDHLDRYGERAKFQFCGHSLGGSLSVLINLMLLTRKVVKPSALVPVVTFGSPFVFCGGQKILDQLGLDENHIHCVIMHRDIVPRAFSCNYPNQVAQLLKSLSGTFRSHSCLNKNKLLYTPMGKTFILQPDEKSSPPHPLLPPGRALWVLQNAQSVSTRTALKAFLNSPHPLETLSDPASYGSNGTILRDHDSSNYLKAVNGLIREHTRMVVRRARQQRHLLWPILTSQSPHAWGHDPNSKENLLTKEVMTRV